MRAPRVRAAVCLATVLTVSQPHVNADISLGIHQYSRMAPNILDALRLRQS
jgi:hypothetical protein